MIKIKVVSTNGTESEMEKVRQIKKELNELYGTDINMDEEVSFIEAVQAYENGKTIYSQGSNPIETYTYELKGSPWDGLEDDYYQPISSREILTYKWYVKEENK